MDTDIINKNNQTAKSYYDIEKDPNYRPLEGEHKGHEDLHSNILLYLLLWSICLQVILIFWKQHRPISFYKATLSFLWFYPLFYATYHVFYRFLIIFTLFNALFVYMYVLSTRNPIGRKTPKVVFSVFYILFLNSIVFSGLSVVVFFLFGHFEIPLFYSLYFGVMSRDLSELCSDKIANVLGLGGGKLLPTSQVSSSYCAICTTNLKDSSSFHNNLMISNISFKQSLESKFDRIMKKFFSQEPFELSCKHVFHEWCIRGWVIIGKKNCCPTCNEKCEIKLTKNPWDQQVLSWWGSLLDATRAGIILFSTSQAIVLIFDR
ncbi:hypothetical protein CYY_008120 [Polysphondylium violaceum]|uniref:RING-type domain-containing protein n=1 Tax=Polysphondylium violaceum TaxID=133409 RepID=A0A8J4PM46_9MYCE|nr:hypothetical protein CYY_008120 [Polysphondylium violaceum]